MVDTSQNSKQQRNKFLVLIIIGFGVLCLAVCAVVYFSLRRAADSIVKDNPEDGKNLASQITDYDLPVGYKEMGGTTIFGAVTAALAEEANDENTIWLVQAPSDTLPVAENFLQDAVVYQRNNPITWTTEDVKIITIRGEETSITIYNGITQYDQKYRAWAGNFTGKGGPALIVIVGSAETWNDELANTFIASMK